MSQRFYQVGGSLPPDIPSYICREADKELYFYLKEKKYCYVLNARQVGKSSLRIRTSKTLEQEGYCCINIDITSIGSNDISADEWYFSLIDNIIEQLALEEDEFVEWWEESANLTPVRRFAKAFEKFILNASEEEIIIFIDEVDSILGVNNFSTDDFFAVIRTFYNLRAESPQYNRITFALFGVATPEDLMRDSSRTPFNIAHSVTIKPFELEASLSLTNGLRKQTVDRKKILEHVFYYTEGMPYLTQKILEYISLNPIKEIKEIEKIIEKLFIKEGTNEKNLRNVQKRVLNNKKYHIKMLNIILRVLQGEPIQVDDGDLRHIYLKLSGLLSNQNGLLKYSNRIYKRVFNKAWLDESFHKINRPFAPDLNRWLELDRDHSALLKGEVLLKAKEWAEEREDLTPIEHRFLNKSIEEELKEASHKEVEREKKRSHLKSIRFLAGAFITSLIFIAVIYEQKELLKTEKESAEKSRHRAEEQSKKLESANLLLNTNALNKKRHQIEPYLKDISASKNLLQYDPLLHSKKITKSYIGLTDIYIEKKEISSAEKNYKEILTWKHKLEENNLSNFNTEVAQISERIAQLYQESNQTNKVQTYYFNALNLYEKNPHRHQIKRANLYYQLAYIYLKEKNKELAIVYHDLGFAIYKELLPKETYLYLPKLAERFLWQAEVSSQNYQKRIYYTKALNIYQQLKQDYLLKFNKKILFIQKKLTTLPNKQKEKQRREKRGWLYIGQFNNTKWQKQFLGFNKNKYTPQLLKSTKQIAINNMNVRQSASPKSKVINGIRLGANVKIIKIKAYQDGYIWAFVEFQ